MAPLYQVALLRRHVRRTAGDHVASSRPDRAAGGGGRGGRRGGAAADPSFLGPGDRLLPALDGECDWPRMGWRRADAPL